MNTNEVVQHYIHINDTTAEGISKRLSVSYGIAANVKLSVWEKECEDIQKPYEHLTKQLIKKKNWDIKMCKKQLGVLSDFRYRSNLKSELFDSVRNINEIDG